MKQSIRICALIIFILSLLALAWVNTGRHEEVGSDLCGGGQFMPRTDIIYNGPCLGPQTIKFVPGRYDNLVVWDTLLGGLAVLNLSTYLLLATSKKPHQTKKAQKSDRV